MASRKRVLVVDDEPRILRFVCTTLRLAGYEAIPCSDGAEAIEIAEREKPDVMLLDIIMKPLDGFDVLKRVRQFSAMPVIVSTARQEYAERAISAGATSHLPKPFGPETLVQAVAALTMGTAGRPGLPPSPVSGPDQR